MRWSMMNSTYPDICVHIRRPGEILSMRAFAAHMYVWSWAVGYNLHPFKEI